MRWVVLTLLVLPFAAAALTLWAGHRAEAATRGMAIVGAALVGLLATVVAVPHLGDRAPLSSTFSRVVSSGPPIELSTLVDPLGAVLLLLAGIVSFLVQVYSLGYLRNDPRYPSYAALVLVFTGAMFAVVIADDLWVLLVGWELMGACSYFLIAHHWELPEARSGAVKAFLMTRTADLGLLFAILVLGARFDSYRISTILSGDVAGQNLPALLLVIAVIGKSAQFPLHTWLPDAMPGPTPISALIHAATMVAAGVYLIARVHPLVLGSQPALVVLALVAATTMVTGAVYALVADDLKRVLAWSTVSQLAYMFGALAVGAWSAAVLHLLAHGAFKALLFLSAGAVVHAVGHTSMTSMGGLRAQLPDTFVTMTIGFAALAGVVPFVGFFTKDAVINGALHEARTGELLGGGLGWLLLAAMLLTTLLTVAYAARAWLRVFFGPARSETAHEPSPSMRVPLYLLAVPTVVGGIVVADPEALLGPRAGEEPFNGWLALTMTALVAIGALAVLAVARRTEGRDPWPAGLSALTPPVDRAYRSVVVNPVRALARMVRAGDRDVVESYVEGADASTRGVGRLLTRTQTGNVSLYLLVVVLGALLVAAGAGIRS